MCFFPLILGTLHHWREAKTPYLLGLRVLASSRWALLRRTGRCCPIGPSEGATLDMAGAALDSFEAASPWDFFLGNIPLALQEGGLIHLAS